MGYFSWPTNSSGDYEIAVHEAMELYPWDIEKRKEYVENKLKKIKEGSSVA